MLFDQIRVIYVFTCPRASNSADSISAKQRIFGEAKGSVLESDCHNYNKKK
jgi:hypothetical protein